MIRRFLKQRRELRAMSLLPIKKAILGNEPMIGVDVGSAGGMQPHWRSYEGVVDFYLFEPHQESYEKLKALFSDSPYADLFHVLPIGLAAAGGERTLHMLNCPTGSSLYPVNPASEFASPDNSYIYPIREVQIQTRCLDEVLSEQKVTDVDIIKLDVQGAELEILKGLGDARRKHILLAEIEVNVSSGVTNNIGPYEGGPTWGEVDELLTAEGMRLLDVSVARSYRAKGADGDWYQREVFDVYENSPSLSARIWEADVVYVRDWRLLVAEKDAASIRKLAVALCGYRFFSEAYFMIEKAEAAGVFDAAAARTIKNSIVVWHRAGRYFWQGRSGMWRLLRRLLRATGMSQLLRWKQYMWFDYPNG
ncbi:MAG: FkbM family methyltransferase [Gallionella sp.]|jgi:FkbM family methyltransferase|nr:FkbM family methyltransferase [Gallionella sp.]MCK9354142.1 FkbM family methyltransferase [Gallionella sp.]